ncbi:MAG: hypothetical protein JOY84_19605 [Curvibacter sp.]|nr:hypothetical protein [Curvibacter sp.]
MRHPINLPEFAVFIKNKFDPNHKKGKLKFLTGLPGRDLSCAAPSGATASQNAARTQAMNAADICGTRPSPMGREESANKVPATNG